MSAANPPTEPVVTQADRQINQWARKTLAASLDASDRSWEMLADRIEDGTDNEYDVVHVGAAISALETVFRKMEELRSTLLPATDAETKNRAYDRLNREHGFVDCSPELIFDLAWAAALSTRLSDQGEYRRGIEDAAKVARDFANEAALTIEGRAGDLSPAVAAVRGNVAAGIHIAKTIRALAGKDDNA